MFDRIILAAVTLAVSIAASAAKDERKKQECPTLDPKEIGDLLRQAPSCQRAIAQFDICELGSSGDVILGLSSPKMRRRFLGSAKPGDIPIFQPTKFQLIINLRAAKALGLDLSPTVIARADDDRIGEVSLNGTDAPAHIASLDLRAQDGLRPRLFPVLVQKMRQALTFLATVENDDPGMKTLAVIAILALLTISGAAYTDLILTGDQQAAQRTN